MTEHSFLKTSLRKFEDTEERLQKKASDDEKTESLNRQNSTTKTRGRCSRRKVSGVQTENLYLFFCIAGCEGLTKRNTSKVNLYGL